MLAVERRVSAGGNDLQGLQNALALINTSEKFNFNMKLYSFDIKVYKSNLVMKKWKNSLKHGNSW